MPTIPPLLTLAAAPGNGVIGLVAAVGPVYTDASVVPPVPVAPYGAGAAPPPVGYAGAGAGVPAARPTLGAPEAPSAELPVVKCT